MKTLLVPMSSRSMARAFGWFMARQVAIVVVGASVLLNIPKPLTHVPLLALVCIVTVAAFVASMLAQHYTYLFSDRGIFITNLSGDPRLFRRTLALWERDKVESFRRWEQEGEGRMQIDLLTNDRLRSLVITYEMEDDGRLAKELDPLLQRLKP